MAGFSYGQAVGAGFKILGRRPLAVLAWVVAYLVIVALPVFLAVSPVLPDLVEGYRGAAHQLAQGHLPDQAALFALRSRVFGLQPVVFVTQIVSRAILMAAIYRAVLEPDNSRWGYLRLGVQELWLGLVSLVYSVMAAVMLLTVFIPISLALGIGIASAERGASPGLAALILLCLVAVVGAGGIAWVMARLSLALPMAFAEKRFVLYESWSLTRGKALKIVLVVLGLLAVIVVVDVVVAGVAWNTIVRGLLTHADWRARLQAPAATVARNLLPLMAGVAALGALVRVVAYVLVVAPLASIYQQVTRDTAASQSSPAQSSPAQSSPAQNSPS